MIFFKKIPFQLGSEILLRSCDNLTHKAKSRIVGVLEKELIMIVEPVFAISDNIIAIVDDLLVAYLHEGYLFTFRSRFHKKLIMNVICIDYPKDFEVEQLRTEQRVRVNLEAVLLINALNLTGLVKDISETGCSFELPKIISLFKGLGLIATFTLPNDQLIKDLQCTITNVKYNQIHRRTEIGVRFLGPAEEISKIGELVQFCMRFKV
ncbi:MAG TPA: PilZ domain-containing protein [Syntrophobacteraceae bacterium]|nr:PilZ domain-containing protein [Syntrophobacteraceae bacterium]